MLRGLAAALLVACLLYPLATDAAGGSPSPPWLRYRVVRTLPHDPSAFTEGLLWHAGLLYESTGLVGASSLREVDPGTGRVLRQVQVPPPVFGEGLALLNGRLYQLTWQQHETLVWGLRCFCRLATFPLRGEGWGLTTDGRRLYLSDGSDAIRVVDPSTMRQVGTLVVGARGRPVQSINELEWTPYGLLANIWPTDVAVRIDPVTGRVTGRIDLSRLGDGADRSDIDNVPNGIAWVPGTGHLLVTGKRWRHLYELALSV